jgi:uncharacterized protein YraI
MESSASATGEVEPVATQSPSSPPSAAPRSDAEQVREPARCLDAAAVEAKLDLMWKVNNELSVVRVSPADMLNLRAAPGARAPVVARLAHDQRGIKATKSACVVGGSTWIEVRAGTKTGWANERFLMPTTTPQRSPSSSAASGFHASAEELARAWADASSEPSGEPPVRGELVGLRYGPARTTAVAVVVTCCFGDDSVMGKQHWIEMSRGADGRWRVSAERSVQLCPRGASGDLCF